MHLNKHGISEIDIRFVFENGFNSIVLEKFPLKVILFGFDSLGRALEIGYIINNDGYYVIMHAMKLRKTYQKYLI